MQGTCKALTDILVTCCQINSADMSDTDAMPAFGETAPVYTPEWLLIAVVDGLFASGLPANLDCSYFGQHAFHQVQAKLAEYTSQLKHAYQLRQPLMSILFVPQAYVTLLGESSSSWSMCVMLLLPVLVDCDLSSLPKIAA